MKTISIIILLAITTALSGQTLKTYNYTCKGKIIAHTAIIKVKGNTVRINGKKRALKGKTYTVEDKTGKLVGLNVGRRYYTGSLLKSKN